MPTELRLTRHPGHAAELAHEAASAGYDMVIAAGGDGTVNDVIQSLAGYRTALGVLPMGTVNVWAREMGISLSASEARETLLHGVRRRVDLGRAGQRYFLMMAGVGFDAEVARRVEKGRLKRFGLKLLEYLATVSFLSVTRPPDTIRITMGAHKRSQQALMVVIGNTRLYGGAMTFTRKAIADDGALDIVVVGSGGLFHRIGVLGRALLRRPAVGPRVRYERSQYVRLDAKRPVPVQVDGEVIGYLPMSFSVSPLALTVIVPRAAAPKGLFSRAPEGASRRS
jgi:YegS/Rv2252/BmrU family lipid kinase